MALSEFYDRAHPFTILTIRHLQTPQGPRMQFVGSTSPPVAYKAHWQHLTPLMTDGKYYAVSGRILNTGSSHATIHPIGIMFEMTEQEAKQLRAEHYNTVMSGLWNGGGPDFYKDAQELHRCFVQNWLDNNLKTATKRDRTRKGGLIDY